MPKDKSESEWDAAIKLGFKFDDLSSRSIDRDYRFDDSQATDKDIGPAIDGDPEDDDWGETTNSDLESFTDTTKHLTSDEVSDSERELPLTAEELVNSTSNNGSDLSSDDDQTEDSPISPDEFSEITPDSHPEETDFFQGSDEIDISTNGSTLSEDDCDGEDSWGSKRVEEYKKRGVINGKPISVSSAKGRPSLMCSLLDKINKLSLNLNSYSKNKGFLPIVSAALVGGALAYMPTTNIFSMTLMDTNQTTSEKSLPIMAKTMNDTPLLSPLPPNAMELISDRFSLKGLYKL